MARPPASSIPIVAAARHAQLAELLFQRAPRALDELAQVELLGELVQREQPRVQVTDRGATLVLVQLVVGVVHRVVVHQHEIRLVLPALDLQVCGLLVRRVADDPGVDDLDVPRVTASSGIGLKDPLELARIRVGLVHAKAERPRVAEREDPVGIRRLLVRNFGVAQALRVDRDRRLELVSSPAGTHSLSDVGIVDVEIGPGQYSRAEDTKQSLAHRECRDEGEQHEPEVPDHGHFDSCDVAVKSAEKLDCR